VSEEHAGPVLEAKRQPAEAQTARQLDGDVGSYAAGTETLWALGSRALPPGLLNRAERPAGRGFRGVQTAHVLHLQRLHGNRDVARLLDGAARGQATAQLSTAPRVATPIQPKLSVNVPGDPYEQQADRFADDVMRMPASTTGPTPPIAEAETPGVQRACAACADESVQRLPTVVGSILRANGTIGDPAWVSPGVEARIERMRGGGQPLPTIERAFFEDRTGADLSDVRVHTDTTAAETSRELSARAYTIGSDIAFGAGEYRPGTDTGRRLIAHELAHVFQQRGTAQLKRAPADPALAETASQPAEAGGPSPVGAEPVSEEGVCPVCGRQGKGRCSGCGEAFAPVQRLASATQPLPPQWPARPRPRRHSSVPAPRFNAWGSTTSSHSGAMGPST
jgi:hypothetical protein